ncbi:hypothetical protein N5U14_05925 [Aliarcobacter butzleri]|uniref:hypothetical protein n=1 Tax=Aliarcobacter butzleri TaxID=28197 RepID=UPI0021B354DB|nr:hypothetical protein [Aliarcobacter butzleri]MCT7610377.1 hypothetical protein [Aliarcobacter butzleri]
MKTISLYDLIIKYPYKSFFEKQFFYALHPYAHFKDKIFEQNKVINKVEILNDRALSLVKSDYKYKIKKSKKTYLKNGDEIYTLNIFKTEYTEYYEKLLKC